MISTLSKPVFYYGITWEHVAYIDKNFKKKLQPKQIKKELTNSLGGFSKVISELIHTDEAKLPLLSFMIIIIIIAELGQMIQIDMYS